MPEAAPRAFEECFFRDGPRRRVRQAPAGRRSPEWKRRRALRRVRAFFATHRARMGRSDRHACRSARVLADYARQLERETPFTATLCANETARRLEWRRDHRFWMLARETSLLCASNGWVARERPRTSEREGEKAANHTEHLFQMHEQLCRLHSHSFEAHTRRQMVPSCNVRPRGDHDSGQRRHSWSRGHDNSRMSPIEGI